MKSARFLFMTAIVAAIFLQASVFSAVFAAPSLVQGEWKIEFLGTMNVPIGFSAVEVKDFKKFMEQEKNAAANKNKPTPATAPGKPTAPAGSTAPDFFPADFPLDKNKAMDRLNKVDFALYHLTMDDGEAIHMAWFLAAIDGEAMPAEVDIFSKELTPDQSKKLDDLKEWVDANKSKAQFTDPTGKMNFKLLDMLPFEVLQQGNQKMWTVGGRALFTVDEMPFAFFTRVYAFPVNNRLAGGVLFGLDGERPFWDPVIKQVLQGLEPAKGK